MPRDFFRSELVGADLVWLLSLSYAGRTFRWSSYPLEITDADGEVYVFSGELGDVDLVETLDLLTTSPDQLSIPFEVVFPVDVAQLVQQGHDLSAATAEVALHVPGNSWEDRRVVLVGDVVQPTYGAENEPVAFSVEQNLWDDRSLVPMASARVTETTWSSRPSNSEGLYYPVVFGAPGAYVTASGSTARTSGSPAIVVEMTGSDVDTLLIAGHRVSASQVRIYDADGTGEDFSVSHVDDGLNQTVAVVDITSAGTVDRTSEEWWVGWDSGGAMLSDEQTGVREGAGEVIEWFLRQSSISVDRGRWKSLEGQLNKYTLAGYLDEPVSPWEFVADHFLPLLPLSILVGPEGLVPVLWRYSATASDALEHLEVGPGVTRVSPVSYNKLPRDIVNEIRLDYAKRAKTGDSRRSVTILAEPSSATEEISNYYAKISTRRYGTGAKSLNTDVIYDDRTAAQIVKWMLRGEGFSHRQVTYEVGHEYAWLSLGDVITLTDNELFWDTQVALVQAIQWGPVSLDLTLLVLEDILRDNRAVSS